MTKRQKEKFKQVHSPEILKSLYYGKQRDQESNSSFVLSKFSIKCYETLREFWDKFDQISQKNSIIDVL